MDNYNKTQLKHICYQNNIKYNTFASKQTLINKINRHYIEQKWENHPNALTRDELITFCAYNNINFNFIEKEMNELRNCNCAATLSSVLQDYLSKDKNIRYEWSNYIDNDVSDNFSDSIVSDSIVSDSIVSDSIVSDNFSDSIVSDNFSDSIVSDNFSDNIVSDSIVSDNIVSDNFSDSSSDDSYVDTNIDTNVDVQNKVECDGEWDVV